MRDERVGRIERFLRWWFGRLCARQVVEERGDFVEQIMSGCEHEEEFLELCTIAVPQFVPQYEATVATKDRIHSVKLVGHARTQLAVLGSKSVSYAKRACSGSRAFVV